jgi:phosphoserine phosphatase
VLAAFERTLRGPEWRRLLLVAHDGVNRVILAWAAQAGLGALAAFEQDMAASTSSIST